MKLSTRALGALAMVAACVALSTVAGAVAGYTTVTRERITNSTVDSTPIGATTPAYATVTGLTSTGGDIVANNSGALRAGPTGIVTAGTPGFYTGGPYVGSTGSFSGSVTAAAFIGNASSATSLASTPTNCGAFGTSYGVDARGNALCINLANNFGQTGYQYLPDGLIVEWVKGVNAVNGRGQTSETLPLTFPHGCLGASATVEFTSYVSDSNYQGAAFYLEPNGCGTSSVSMQYDVRGDGHASSSYIPRIVAIGW